MVHEKGGKAVAARAAAPPSPGGNCLVLELLISHCCCCSLRSGLLCQGFLMSLILQGQLVGGLLGCLFQLRLQATLHRECGVPQLATTFAPH